MKRVLLALLTIGCVCFLTAQTASPSWNGMEEVQTVSQCVLHNADSVLCIGTDGIKYSYQGAAFVTVGAQGPAGPAGTAGATGPQGPAGPQGPPGPAATNPVTSVNGKTGAVVLNVTSSIQ